MKKIKPFIEIICYIVLPIIIWKYGRDVLGDYYAMLLSTVPGIIYTVINFFVERQFNVTGLFIMASLVINTILDLVSQSPEWMLWNSIYFNVGMIVFLLITILIKRPIVMYFMIDMAYLQGKPRKESYEQFTSKEIFKYFQWLTGFLILRDVIESVVKIALIHKHGVDGYDQILVVMRTVGYIFSALFVAAIVFVFNKLGHFDEVNKVKE